MSGTVETSEVIDSIEALITQRQQLEMKREEGSTWSIISWTVAAEMAVAKDANDASDSGGSSGSEGGSGVEVCR